MATTSSPQRSRSSKRPADRAARNRARANGRPAGDAAKAQERTAHAGEGTTGTLPRIVHKTKKPALAGGAALAAIAGGIALARNGRRSTGFSLPSVGRKRRGIHISMPHLPHRSDGEPAEALRATAKAFGAAAVEVGKAGYRAGELASEVRRVRELAAAARKGD